MDFRILGSLEVRDDEGRELPLGAGRQRALLALLLLHENEVVSTDRLVDELWGEGAPSTAAKIVQNHVSQLRRALGDGRLLTFGHGYVLEVEPGSLDRDRFEALAAEGSRVLAEGDARSASAKLRDALSLWRGAPLAEFAYEPFAQATIARLEELRLTATEERIDAELALGLHAELVGELEELIRRNPLRERLHAQLMLALYRSGRQAEALEAYRAARTALVEELGLEPGEELQELQRAILAHDPRLAPPPRAAVAVIPSRARLGARARVLRRPRVLAALGALLVAGAVAAALVALTGSERRPIVVAPNSVAVVDPRSGGIVDQVRVGSRPVAVAVDRDGVWVANADDETVSRIDPRTREVVKVIGTGAPAADIAVGEGSVWLATGSEGKLLRIDPRTNTPVKTIDLSGPDKLVPMGAYSVVTGAGAVWVGSGSRAVLKIDPETEVPDSIPIELTPTDIAFGAGDLWVVAIGGRILRIDPKTGDKTGEVAAAPYARAIAAGEGGVWVTDLTFDGRGLLWRIDPATVTITGGPTTLPAPPVGVTTGGGAVWVADGRSGAVFEIDPASGKVRRSIPVGNAPLDVAYGDGKLWVTVGTREAAP